LKHLCTSENVPGIPFSACLFFLPSFPLHSFLPLLLLPCLPLCIPSFLIPPLFGPSFPPLIHSSLVSFFFLLFPPTLSLLFLQPSSFSFLHYFINLFFFFPPSFICSFFPSFLHLFSIPSIFSTFPSFLFLPSLIFLSFFLCRSFLFTFIPLVLSLFSSFQPSCIFLFLPYISSFIHYFLCFTPSVPLFIPPSIFLLSFVFIFLYSFSYILSLFILSSIPSSLSSFLPFPPLLCYFLFLFLLFFYPSFLSSFLPAFPISSFPSLIPFFLPPCLPYIQFSFINSFLLPSSFPDLYHPDSFSLS